MYEKNIFKVIDHRWDICHIDSLTATNIFVFSTNQQRSQKIFKASSPMDLQAARTKIMGFGMQLLDGIDPNPDNFVCAGIIHMRSQQVGCLLRLEPNKNAQVNSNQLNR